MNKIEYMETAHGTMRFVTVPEAIRGSKEHPTHMILDRWLISSVSKPEIEEDDRRIYIPGSSTVNDHDALRVRNFAEVAKTLDKVNDILGEISEEQFRLVKEETHGNIALADFFEAYETFLNQTPFDPDEEDEDTHVMGKCSRAGIGLDCSVCPHAILHDIKDCNTVGHCIPKTPIVVQCKAPSHLESFKRAFTEVGIAIGDTKANARARGQTGHALMFRGYMLLFSDSGAYRKGQII